ncbi:MAG: hypothetical protein WAK01_20460 [Methylocystis sp.]
MNKAILFAIALALSPPGSAWASSAHPRECLMAVGPNWLSLSAVQPQTPHDTHCNHLPNAGPTVLILDTEQAELREMPIEIRILRDVGQKDWRDDLDANTAFVLPEKKYLAGNGTFSFDYDFGADGHYIALVRAVSEDGSKEYTGQFAFSVGDTLVFYLSVVMTAAAFCFFAFGIWRKDAKACPEKLKRLHGDSPVRGDEGTPSPEESELHSV